MSGKVSGPVRRLLLTGDEYGIRELLSVVPRERVVGFIAAENRPQYHAVLRDVARSVGAPLLIQPLQRNERTLNEFLRGVSDLAPDGLLCHSYSMLLSSKLLDMVEGRAFNLHTALLPRNRGPNPVQWALIHGEKETGVTLHQMDEGLDSGAIIDQLSIPIHDEDTWVTLMARVRGASSILLKRSVPKLLEGAWQGRPQDEAKATRNPRIPKESFRIDFERMRDREIFNLIRAQVAPLAGAYIETGGERVHVTQWLSMEAVRELRKKYSNV